MKTKILILSTFVFLLISCGSSKYVPTEEEMQALNKLIDTRQFIIESDRAYPQATMAMQQVMNSGLMLPGDSAGNISLIGNYNFLKIEGDSITSRLPYFGERQMLIDYGGQDSSIEFDGVIKNLQVEKNKRHGYNLSFNAKSSSENFSVYISIYPGLKTEMILNGTGRFPIRYSGEATPITDQQKDE